MALEVSVGSRSVTAVTANSHSGSDPSFSVVLSGAPANTAIGDKFVDSAGKSFLITGISSATLTVQSFPFASNTPADGAGNGTTTGITKRAVTWDEISTVLDGLNLTTGTGSGQIMNVRVYNDAEISTSSSCRLGGANQTSTVDSTHYFDLAPATGQGAFEAGTPLKYDQSKGVGINFTSLSTLEFCVRCTAQYSRIRGLQVKYAQSAQGLGGLLRAALDNCIIDGNLLEINHTNAAFQSGAIYTYGAGQIIRNNVVIAAAQTPGGYIAITIESTTSRVLGNTCVVTSDVNASGGYGVGTNQTDCICKDNACFGYPTAQAFSGTFGSGSGFNATDNSSAPGSSNQTSLTYSSQFVGVTVSARDFRAKSGGSLHNGTPDATYLAKDIFGNTRDGTTAWIGAAEVSSAVVANMTRRHHAAR